MRENRSHGSEGGEDGVLLYPYIPALIYSYCDLRLATFVRASETRAIRREVGKIIQCRSSLPKVSRCGRNSIFASRR